jgi:Flp pilus assembly pilin Flp
LIATGIAVAIIATVNMLGSTVTGLYDNVNAKLSGQ